MGMKSERVGVGGGGGGRRRRRNEEADPGELDTAAAPIPFTAKERAFQVLEFVFLFVPLAAFLLVPEFASQQSMAASVRGLDSKSAIGVEVADMLVNLSREAVAARGKFTVAFSGGSLPGIVASGILSRAEEIAWDKWHVFFADERFVPLDHVDSNYRACHADFLGKVSIKDEHIYTINAAGSLQGAADEYAAALQRVAGASPRLDAVLLGMGPDGHTCSLFPGHELLDETSALVAPISDSPKPPSQRITLTFPVVNAARNVLFVAAGGSKADVLPKVVNAPPAAEGEEALPAARVSPSEGNLVWFVDNAAAAKL